MTYAFDVFLSHCSEDRRIALDLAERLKADSLRVWFDEWNIRAGDIIPLAIENGLENSRALVLCMSERALASDWVRLERATVIFRDPANSERRFIPVRLDDAQVGDSLRQYAYIDWRSKAPHEYMKLLAACREPVPFAPQREQVNVVQPNRTFRSHSAIIQDLAMTPDASFAVSVSFDARILVWDLRGEKCLRTLTDHSGAINGIALSRDGKRAVSTSHDNSMRLWDLLTGQSVRLETPHMVPRDVALSQGGLWAAVSFSDDTRIALWDLQFLRRARSLDGHTGQVTEVSISHDDKQIISASADKTVRVWDRESGQCTNVLEGHKGSVTTAQLTPDGFAVSGSLDNTVRVWELRSNRCIAVLEGHAGAVLCLSTADGGRLALSGSSDRTARLWHLESGKCVVVLKGSADSISSLVIGADGHDALTADGQLLRTWKLPPADEWHTSVIPPRYTNAKALLVGDSGVGKTGLAVRLTQHHFEYTISTDAAWATQVKLPTELRSLEIDREIWLWDFAGQADYRLIHQLFMDEAALAIYVFNPQNEDPFEGLMQWDRALSKAARRPFSKILVAGRCDRGRLMVSEIAVERFRIDHSFAAYLETSALTGEGCAELRHAILHNIDWESIEWTSTPRAFRILKEAILKLRDEGSILMRIGELKQQLEMRMPNDRFPIETIRAVVALLAGPGIVWQLEFGDFILFQPELINAYAAAVVRSVRASADGVSSIEEDRLLSGHLEYQDMRRLPGDDESVVLRAMHHLLVRHGLCLRESTGSGVSLLVFPSYFRRERPPQAIYLVPTVTYEITGALDEIYTTLIVRLHHTPGFSKDQLWRYAADFRAASGERAGIVMVKGMGGAGEITVSLDPKMPEGDKGVFLQCVHDHLKAKDPALHRIRHFVCPFCGEAVENQKAIQARIGRGLRDIVCAYCELRISLGDSIEEMLGSEEFQYQVRKLEQQSRRSIDNDSEELILSGHAFSIAAESSHVFRADPYSDIDGEIEFRADDGGLSGQRVYLRFRSRSAYSIDAYVAGRCRFRLLKRESQDWHRRQPLLVLYRSASGEIVGIDFTKIIKMYKLEEVETGVECAADPFTARALQVLREVYFSKRLL